MVREVLCCPTNGFKAALKRKRGHIYFAYEKESQTLSTHPELMKDHKNVSHPASAKLYSLLKLAKTLQTNTETEQF